MPNQIQQFIFKKEFLTKYNISYPPTYICEDITFNSLCISKSQKIGYSKSFEYIYKKGISTTKKIKNLERSLDPLICYDFFKAKSKHDLLYPEVIQRLFYLFICRFICEIYENQIDCFFASSF